jgi:hypothetical protein
MLHYLRIAVTALSVTVCGCVETTSVTVITHQAAIVDFEYEGDDLAPLFNVVERLDAAISRANLGWYDAHDIDVDQTNGTFYMYGADAEALFAVVRPILSSDPCLSNVRITLRSEDGTSKRTEVLP